MDRLAHAFGRDVKTPAKTTRDGKAGELCHPLLPFMADSYLLIGHQSSCSERDSLRVPAETLSQSLPSPLNRLTQPAPKLLKHPR